MCHQSTQLLWVCAGLLDPTCQSLVHVSVHLVYAASEDITQSVRSRLDSALGPAAGSHPRFEGLNARKPREETKLLQCVVGRRKQVLFNARGKRMQK